MKKLKHKIGWLLFELKYKLGLAKEGKDFYTVGQEDELNGHEKQSTHDPLHR